MERIACLQYGGLIHSFSPIDVASLASGACAHYRVPHHLHQLVDGLTAVLGLFLRSVHRSAYAIQQAWGVAMRRSTPYGLTLLGLIGGMLVLLFTPLPSAMLNYLIGGALLAVAVASVTYMIAEFSGPGERGPNF